ncbi:MAG TPA: DUF6448 family protein [Acidobacteriota bacterium]|nr:DUF6448 family protein [Acidobacteriota bacterium]
MKFRFCLFTVIAIVLLLWSASAYSHCDALDGPVITDAKKALNTKNVNLVLIWVQKDDETEIRKAFEKTLTMRTLNPEAQEFADRYFFETLVRIHRRGEGAAFSGLKEAGQGFGPAIAAADKAVLSESVESAKQLLLHTVEEGIEQRFKKMKSKQNYDRNDVAAGREYVAAYVDFIHYMEGVYTLGSKNEEHDHP